MASAASAGSAAESGVTANAGAPQSPLRPTHESPVECKQPGCTGTIVDGYCDVCGSPADASPFVPAAPLAAAVSSPAPAERGLATVVEEPETVPRSTNEDRTETHDGSTGTIVNGYADARGIAADVPPYVSAETAASVQSPTPAARPGVTVVRRLVGVAAVLFLLGCAVVFYQVAPGFSVSSSSRSTASSAPTGAGGQSPGGVPSSAGTSASSAPKPPSATTTPRPSATARTRPAAKTIQVAAVTGSAKPFQAVEIRGTYRGGAGIFLQVQRLEGGKWQSFPFGWKADRSGQFTAYVDFPQPGNYRVRMLDPKSGLTSKALVVVIRG
jgi:hypothetical protein